MLAEGGFALQVFGIASAVRDSTRAWSATEPFHAVPLEAVNLPEYFAAETGIMWNTSATRAVGVGLQAGMMLGFRSHSGSDFLFRSALSVRRRTWMSNRSYRDLSVGLLIAEVEKLRPPSGPEARPGVTASLLWGKPRWGAFVSVDAVKGDVEPRYAVHGGVKFNGSGPVALAAATAAGLFGLFNIPIM